MYIFDQLNDTTSYFIMKVLRTRALNEMAVTVIWKRRGLLSFLYAKAYKQHIQKPETNTLPVYPRRVEYSYF